MITTQNMIETTLTVQFSRNFIDTIQEKLDASNGADSLSAYAFVMKNINDKLLELNLSSSPVFSTSNETRVITSQGVVLDDYSAVIVSRWFINGMMHLKLADGNVVNLDSKVSDF